jgi:hypothetical protein
MPESIFCNSELNAAEIKGKLAVYCKSVLTVTSGKFIVEENCRNQSLENSVKEPFKFRENFLGKSVKRSQIQFTNKVKSACWRLS